MHGADTVPALFSIGHAILLDDQIWIGENARRELKIDAFVLLLVRSVFGRIPFEAHGVIRNV